MPFVHPFFFYEYYRTRQPPGTQLVEQFKMVSGLAKKRTIRLMIKINDIIENMNECLNHIHDNINLPSINDAYGQVELRMSASARAIGIDPTYYLAELHKYRILFRAYYDYEDAVKEQSEWRWQVKFAQATEQLTNLGMEVQKRLGLKRPPNFIKDSQTGVEYLSNPPTLPPPKVPFTITPEMRELYESDVPVEECVALGVHPGIYLDESSDADDIQECTSSFCWAQMLTGPSNATDSVNILRDLSGEDWVILIERKNGPGKNQYAFPGGFVDIGESHEAAGAREFKEEVKMSGFHQLMAPKKPSAGAGGGGGRGAPAPAHTRPDDGVHIPAETRLWWDPRARFPHGMRVSATVSYYVVQP